MNEYLSDKDQAQMIKDWWKKHGTTILLVIAVFLVTNFGLQYWQKYTAQNKEQAAGLYSQMVNADTKNNSVEFKLFAQDLMKNFRSTSYASFAALMLARDSVNNNQLDEALVNLRWVNDNSKSPMLRQLAQTRAARILLAKNNPTQALELSAKNDGKKQIFAAIANETRGDALLLQDKEQEAAKAYLAASNIASDGVQESKVSSPLLQMKAEQVKF